MKRRHLVFGFVLIPVILMLIAGKHPVKCMIAFEVLIFLALGIAGLNAITETLTKSEKVLLYFVGVYYAFFTVIFLYTLLPISISENMNPRFGVVTFLEISLGLFSNLWGLHCLRKY